jgi:hypothetical protein
LEVDFFINLGLLVYIQIRNWSEVKVVIVPVVKPRLAVTSRLLLIARNIWKHHYPLLQPSPNCLSAVRARLFLSVALLVTAKLALLSAA